MLDWHYSSMPETASRTYQVGRVPRWRFFTRSTYFDVIEIKLHSANGQMAGDRTRIPRPIPVMYALARCGHLPKKETAEHQLDRNALMIASAVVA